MKAFRKLLLCNNQSETERECVWGYPEGPEHNQTRNESANKSDYTIVFLICPDFIYLLLF
jgi:hypothetical protein